MEYEHYLQSLDNSFVVFPSLSQISIASRIATGCNQLFGSIEAPCLRILDCHGDIASENEGAGLFTFLQGIKSLKTLMMEYYELTGDNAFKCYTLIPSLTHLVLGWPEERFSDFYSRLSLPDPQPDQSRLLGMLYEVEHQFSPASTSTLLLPSLEILEAYGIPSVTDEMLLQFIMARIDASNLDPVRVSKLKKVFVYFTRSRQIDIAPEALAYAQAAGIDLKLELIYFTGRKLNTDWSPSFRLRNDISWPYLCFDY
jgi:hypothetical protein